MHRLALALGAAMALSAGAHAQDAAAPNRMPVKEITVFKDGHAMVLREGTMPTTPAGTVVLDGLPTPVLGTFWPYAADPAAKLHSVVAGRTDARIEKQAVALEDFLQANVGAQVYVTLQTKETFAGTIVSVPRRAPEPDAPVLEPAPAFMVLLKTLEGLRPVPIGSIDHVTFRDKNETVVVSTEPRPTLTLRLDWAGAAPAKTAKVGMMYLQKGFRWIPSYRIDLDGKGKAVVKLEATLVNELIDLENVTAHLVIGVPSFAFKGSTDPVALQRTLVQLSQYFQENSNTQYAAMNSIRSQTSRMGERFAAAEAPAGDVNLPADGAREDLFIFPVKNVTLKKGEVMVVPVAEFAVETKDVYTLDVAMVPPREARSEMSGSHAAEIAKLMAAPKVMHKIRVSNPGPAPLTTAPAMILKNGQALAQGQMTYTSPGGTADVEITAAVDIQVKKSENETTRTPNQLKWRGNDYQRIDLEGKLSLTNYRSTAVEVEVRRTVLGEATSAGPTGRMERVNVLEDYREGEGSPWWTGYWWWSEVNGVSRITWKATVEPGKSVDLPYAWHYFWR